MVALPLRLAALQEKEAASAAFPEAQKSVIESIYVRAAGVFVANSTATAPLAMSEAAMDIIHGFLGQLIDVPAEVFASTSEGLAGPFR